MNKLHFIVNPIAGKGQSVLDEAFLTKHFTDGNNQIAVSVSEYPGHATLLAKEALEAGADTIVACGGDGTINEVASCLVHSDAKLGIVPLGSGNGLAESLKIPRNVPKALQVIKTQSEKKIDVATVNGKPFFSNMGIGFDAQVISYYNASGHRRIWAYFKAFFKSLRTFKNEGEMQVELDGKKFRTQPFLFFVSNSKIMGYDISLTRMASLQDGILDVVVIDAMGRLHILFMGLLVLLHLNKYLKRIHYYKTKRLRILFKDKANTHLMQADGELHQLQTREMVVGVEQGALRVLCPV